MNVEKKTYLPLVLVILAAFITAECGSSESGGSNGTSTTDAGTDATDGGDATGGADGTDTTDGGDATGGADGTGSTDGTDGGDATGGADGGDATDGADGGEVGQCPGDFPDNERCNSEGTSCTNTYEYCATQISDTTCDCKNGKWQCSAPGGAQPVDCHECCQAANEAMWFCFNGDCVKASGCEAIDCCVPGAKGDAWCKSNFGDCSSCVAGPTDGGCGPKDCN
jgi:hypothetical protein